MAYSNVTPPALPAYDTTAYPCYVLVFNYDVGATDWYEGHLMASASAFYYDTAAGHATINETSHLRYEISSGESEWTEWGAVEAAPTIKPGQTAQIYQRIWTNHDILDTAGKVWLAADSVTSVEDKRDLRSHVLGIVLALIQKALSPIRKQPTAYLYNGVKLPALPEDGYPCWFVSYNSYLSKYLFTASTEHGFRYATGTDIATMGSFRQYSYEVEKEEWALLREGSGGTVLQSEVNSLIWCNENVVVENSTEVYFEASEPIPVYE